MNRVDMMNEFEIVPLIDEKSQMFCEECGKEFKKLQDENKQLKEELLACKLRINQLMIEKNNLINHQDNSSWLHNVWCMGSEITTPISIDNNNKIEL